MTARTRTAANCLNAAMATRPFDPHTDYAPDSEGWGRWRETELAAQHLAAMSPERRAQLEQEWAA